MDDQKKTVAKDEFQIGLSLLIENVREEVETWELDPFDNTDPSATPPDLAAIRHGLYLIALDILLCESQLSSGGGGYEHFKTRFNNAGIPRIEYDAMKKELVPYIHWLDSLSLKRALTLQGAGFSQTEALQEAIDVPMIDAALTDAAPTSAETN